MSDPFCRKVALSTPLQRTASSTVACMFCACKRCNKWVAPHENRNWLNGVHRKTKHTQYSAPPTHHADSLAHRKSEWSYRQHTTNKRIQWLRRPTANLLRLHMLNRSRQICVAPKASNAAEHTEQICSRPCLSLPKRFRRPTVGPVLHLNWKFNCN